MNQVMALKLFWYKWVKCVVFFQTWFRLDAELASTMFQKFPDKRQEAAVYLSRIIWYSAFFSKVVIIRRPVTESA